MLQNLAKKTNSANIESLECSEDVPMAFLDMYRCIDLHSGETFIRVLNDEEVADVQATEGLYCFEVTLTEIILKTGFWYELCHEW